MMKNEDLKNKSDPDTEHKIKGLMEDDYNPLEEQPVSQRKEEAYVRTLVSTGSRINDQPAKASSASARTAEPGPEGE